MLDTLLQHPVNRELSAAFSAAGVPLYLVGGSVRDALCGTPDFSDLDYTTPARPDEVTRIVSSLGPVWAIGEEFGTIGVKVQGVKVEVTTFRTETYDPTSRKPVVGFGERIEEDLLRRDLTINALALCLVGDGTFSPGELVDLFGGADDLVSGVLRTPDAPSKSMSEDPLRQLRAVRFSVRRGMVLSEGLAAAIREEAHRLEIVAVERCTEELRKILSSGPAALAAALVLANDLGIAAALVGSLPSGTAPVGALRRLGSLSPTAALAVLAFHAARGGLDPVETLRERRLSGDEVATAVKVAATASALHGGAPDGPVARQLIRSTPPVVLDEALAVATAVSDEVPPLAGLVWQLLPLAPELRAPLPITGDDLVAQGLRGPAVGAALKVVTEAFLENPSLTRDEALALV